MTKEVRLKLIEIAKLKTLWSYSQLNEQLELGLDFSNSHHRKLIGEWLGEVSIHECERKRPLLSSLIIHKSSDREQGDGFYKLFARIYNENWQNLKNNPEFELEKMKEYYAFLENNENHKLYINDSKKS